ncbi:hypothetical protein CapIbe_023648, partial [Capra ibex]
PPDGLTLSLDS